MSRGSITRGLALGLLAVAVTVLPGEAIAATTVEFESHDQVLDVYGDDGDNAIRVSGNRDGSATIVDRRSGVIADPAHCAQLDEEAARCQGDLDGVRGGDGADEIEIVPASGQSFLVEIVAGGKGRDLIVDGNEGIEIFGDAGSDRIYGGGGDDQIYGDAGSDRIWAGNGDDTIDPAGIDRGRDWFRGGHGDNEISAVDGRHDAKIACGLGRDRARYDPKKDPPRSNCERQIADDPPDGPPFDA